MRSMPMQFWPADWKVPRRRMEAIFGRLATSSRMRAGSLPPSSRTKGVRDLAAEGDVVSYWAGADEGYVGYGGVRGEVVSGLGPAGDGLDEVGGVATGGEGGTGDVGEELG